MSPGLAPYASLKVRGLVLPDLSIPGANPAAIILLLGVSRPPRRFAAWADQPLGGFGSEPYVCSVRILPSRPWITTWPFAWPLASFVAAFCAAFWVLCELDALLDPAPLTFQPPPDFLVT